jgi:predicted DNA-binding transcriptional regulator AlpA
MGSSPKSELETPGARHVPRLDDLAANPAYAADLAPDVAQALMSRCVIALAALNARLLSGRENGRGNPAPEGDRRLNVEAAAVRLGVSRDYLYRNAGNLPFTVRIGRSLGFSEAGLEKYMRQRTGR